MNWISRWYKPKSENDCESVILQARQKLSQHGAIEALRFLKGSPEAASEAVRQLVQSIAYSHHKDLPTSFLNEPFFDPIWCQCSLCNKVWLIPSIDDIPNNIDPRFSALGVICPKCGRVLCPTCSKILGSHCTCGSAYTVILYPNGRKHVNTMSSESEIDLWSNRLPEIPLNREPYVHLFFGADGRVPVGLDPTLSLKRIASDEDHLGWAEILIEAGCYYQGQQQLELLGDIESRLAKAQLLRARLELVQYHNACKLHRGHLDYGFLPENWHQSPMKIKQRLEEAVHLDPELSEAWLLAAKVYSNPEYGADYRRALECAVRAEVRLGGIGAVVLVKGIALRELGDSFEALRILRHAPTDSREADIIKKELNLTEMEAHCHDNPTDAETALKLGRWYIRDQKHDRAKTLFARLVELCPDLPEGYYGLAKLAFLDFKLNWAERHNQAYELCREALKRDSEFGLAYELLGSVFRNLSLGSSLDNKEEGVSFEVQDYLDYSRRAVRLDATCDVAFSNLAEAHIDKGELQQAIEMLEKAAALDTNNSSVYFILAKIYLGLRQYDKADLAERRAKELSPDTELSAEYEQKILELCGFEY